MFCIREIGIVIFKIFAEEIILKILSQIIKNELLYVTF